MLTNNASSNIGELINVASVKYNQQQMVNQENEVIENSSVKIESLDDFFNV